MLVTLVGAACVVATATTVKGSNIPPTVIASWATKTTSEKWGSSTQALTDVNTHTTQPTTIDTNAPVLRWNTTIVPGLPGFGPTAVIAVSATLSRCPTVS
jgi:hypothetical protein